MNASKYRHVLRAMRRRNCRSASPGSTRRATTGWLSAYAITGAAAHKARTGMAVRNAAARAPAARPETEEGQDDRVGSLVSVAGQERQLQRDLSEGGLAVCPHGAEEDAPWLLWPGAGGYLQEQGI